jgi:hypothetical protein
MNAHQSRSCKSDRDNKHLRKLCFRNVVDATASDCKQQVAGNTALLGSELYNLKVSRASEKSGEHVSFGVVICIRRKEPASPAQSALSKCSIHRSTISEQAGVSYR